MESASYADQISSRQFVEFIDQVEVLEKRINFRRADQVHSRNRGLSTEPRCQVWPFGTAVPCKAT
jgi:hypothetical protein